MPEDFFLVGYQQLAAKIESTRGTAETLTASEVKLKPFAADALFTPDYSRFPNDEVSEDIGEAGDFVAGYKAAIAMGVHVKSSGTVGTPPAIGPYLRACGFQEEIVHAITVGAPSGGDGIFEEGATYSATGSKAGIIEQERNGAGTLYYVPTAGGALADTDVVTVGTDSATCSGSDALNGVKYRPRSTAHETLTIQRAIKNDQGTADQDMLHRLKGAMGTGTITWEALNVAKLAAEFQGVVDADGAAGAFFSGVTYEAGTPPQWVNSTAQFNAVTRQMNAVTLDFGNDLQMEPDPTTEGGVNGYDYCKLGGRAPTITINPYRVKVATQDVLDDLKTGVKRAFVLTWGTSPQLIELRASAVQVRGWTPADRAGRAVEQMTLNICRHATLLDWDYALYFK